MRNKWITTLQPSRGQSYSIGSDLWTVEARRKHRGHVWSRQVLHATPLSRGSRYSSNTWTRNHHSHSATPHFPWFAQACVRAA